MTALILWIIIPTTFLPGLYQREVVRGFRAIALLLPKSLLTHVRQLLGGRS